MLAYAIETRNNEIQYMFNQSLGVSVRVGRQGFVSIMELHNEWEPTPSPRRRKLSREGTMFSRDHI